MDDGFKVSNNEGGAQPEPDPDKVPLPITDRIDGVVVSHAHLDHSGNFPARFVNGKTLGYMTPLSLEISNLLWEDSVKISKKEGNYLDFDTEQIVEANKNTFTMGYRKSLPVTDNLLLEFHDAGHIPGSSMPAFRTTTGKERSVLYTGDFYTRDTNLLKGANIPKEQFDTLIIESTYADREHEERRKTEDTFLEDIEDTLSAGGTALIASFAVGRTQELTEILERGKFGVPIYIDGMGRKASHIISNYPEYVKDFGKMRKSLKKTTWIKHARMRPDAIKKPSIIITTAGMLNGGPVLWYLKKLYKSEQSKLFLTGFQVPGTQGHRLMTEGKIEVDGTDLDVKMQFQKYDFSAHAGQSELHKTVKRVNPERLIAVHGDSANVEVFKEWAKKELGIEAHAPRLGEEITI